LSTKRSTSAHLADAARALDPDDLRLPGARRVVGALQTRELGLPSDEHRGRRARGRRLVFDGARAELVEDRVAGRTLARGLALERSRELAEARQLVGQARERRRRLPGDLGREDLLRGAGEGQAPREHLVEHDADRVPVARRAGAVGTELLGRHVRGRACEIDALVGVASRRRGEAEVEDRHPSALRDEHVGGLEVAMDLARAVDRADPSDELRERAADLGRAEEDGRRSHGVGVALGRLVGGRRARVRRERDAVDPRHREEPPDGVVREELVKAHEVWVHEVREGAELALDLVDRRAVDATERLERDALAALLVERLVDDAHPAGAEPPLDDEAIEQARAPPPLRAGAGRPVCRHSAAS